MITTTTIADKVEVTRHLPLEPLFALLKKHGFQVKPDDYIEILKIIERFGSDDLDETVEYICPVIATSESEQIAFYKIVEEYKKFHFRSLSDGPPKKKLSYLYILLILILAVPVAYLMVKTVTPKPTHTQKLVSDSIVTPSTDSFKLRYTSDYNPLTKSINASVAQDTPGTKRLYSIDVTGYHADQKAEQLKIVLKPWITILLLLPGLVGVLYSIIRQKPPKNKQGKTGGKVDDASDSAPKSQKPPFQIPFERNDLKLVYQEKELLQVLTQMRFKVVEDTFSFNIPKTVYSTIRSGGMPDFMYTPDTRNQEYLILIERSNPKSMMIGLFEYLAFSIKDRDIPVEWFYYDRQLTCSNNTYPLGISLDRMAQQYSSATLILFGKGHEFVFRAYPVIEERFFKILDLWQNKAIITPLPFSDWGEKEKVISSNILLLPADSGGLVKLANALKEKSVRPSKYIEAKEDGSYETSYVDFRDINELKEYLNNDESLFQWLCAVCIFPKLRWEILIETGKVILERYKQPSKLNYTNLLKLCRISWMWEGVFPQQTRTVLLAMLTVDNEVAARRTLLNMFTFSNTFYGSGHFFKDQLELQQVTNEFILYAYNKETYKDYEKSKDVFRHLWESDKIIDAPVKKYLSNDSDKKWQTPINENGQPIGVNAYFNIEDTNASKKIQKSFNKKRFVLGMSSLLIIALWGFLKFVNGPYRNAISSLYKPDPSQIVHIGFKINDDPGACGTRSATIIDSLTGQLIVNTKHYPVVYKRADSLARFEIPYEDYLTRDSSTLQLSLHSWSLSNSNDTSTSPLVSLQKKIMLDDSVNYRITLRCENDLEQTAPGFTAPEYAKMYNFPTGLDGTGQTIALIEMGGGYRQADLRKYFTDLNIKMPMVTAMALNGTKNNPTNASGSDIEVTGEIEIAGSVAPGAKIVVYFAKNTEADFLNAIKIAANDNKNKTSVICINWGGVEKNWTQSALTNFNQAFKDAGDSGITVCVASGNRGSSDGVSDGSMHVDFPSSSPYVLACGGSKLIFKGDKVSSETVWNVSEESATGSGVSSIFPMPDYQKGIENVLGKLAFKGRALPDISANADPAVGYKIYVDGQSQVIGGTSMSTPLIAGLIALINQGAGYNVGFINPLLYSKIGPSGAFHDITVGDNIITSTKLGYKALPGWDAVTGWGSPNGKNLLEFYKSQQTKK